LIDPSFQRAVLRCLRLPPCRHLSPGMVLTSFLCYRPGFFWKVSKLLVNGSGLVWCSGSSRSSRPSDWTQMLFPVPSATCDSFSSFGSTELGSVGKSTPGFPPLCFASRLATRSTFPPVNSFWFTVLPTRQGNFLALAFLSCRSLYQNFIDPHLQYKTSSPLSISCRPLTSLESKTQETQ